jgi:sialate O-acetylesterase
VVYLFLLIIFPAALQAEPTLPHLFSDHMILQRDSEVAVWGWADPGEHVSVTLGPSKRETVTSADGHWNVSLSAVPAGGPYTLVVQGKKTIVFKDVLFGEVWVASGQSNMTYALSGATGAAEEIPKANYDEIRFFTVPKKIALTPQEDTGPAAWEICSPDTAKAFSAVAYFFARDLQRALGVPIGIVLSAWPGTAGEEWTDPESLRREPVLQPIVKRWDASAENVKTFATRPAEIALEFDDFELLSAPGEARGASSFSNFDDGSSRTATGGVWTYNWSDAKSTAFELVTPGRGGHKRICGRAVLGSRRRLISVPDAAADNIRLG